MTTNHDYDLIYIDYNNFLFAAKPRSLANWSAGKTAAHNSPTGGSQKQSELNEL